MIDLFSGTGGTPQGAITTPSSEGARSQQHIIFWSPNGNATRAATHPP
jgi:hypothetical protein